MMFLKRTCFFFILLFVLSRISLFSIAPLSEFSDRSEYTPSLGQEIIDSNGLLYFRERVPSSATSQAAIFHIIEDNYGQTFERVEIFNSFTNKEHELRENSKKQLCLYKGQKRIQLEENEKYQVFLSGLGFKNSEFNWGSLLLDINYVYPPEKDLTAFLKKENILSWEESALSYPDKCRLLDCYFENISPSSLDKRSILESYFDLHRKEADLLPYKNSTVIAGAALNPYLSQVAYCQQLKDQFSPENRKLKNAYSVHFPEGFRYIDLNSKQYIEFKEKIVDQLAYVISTYGGSLHKQVREQFLDYYGINSFHPLSMKIKRNAGEIDNLLGIGTKEGNARFSNNMIRNTEANAWHEAMTYLIKEAEYPWATKNNLKLKEIFPECSAISVFDAGTQKNYKTVSFPFASVSEVFAYWVQINSTHHENLPEFITDNKLWVNHWKYDQERKRLLDLHKAFIEKVLPEFIPLDHEGLSQKFNSYDDLLSLADYNDILMILKSYIHDYLPGFNNQNELIDKVAEELNINPSQVMLADILFLDIGLKNQRAGMPNFIPPSLLFLLNSTSSYDNTDLKNYAKSTSILREIGVDSDVLVPFHFDNIPFATRDIKQNLKLKELETTALMFLSCLKLRSVEASFKQDLVNIFINLVKQSRKPYKSYSKFATDLKTLTEVSFIPDSFRSLIPKIINDNKRLNAFMKVTNEAKVYGLENNLKKLLSFIGSLEVFDHFFSNEQVAAGIIKDSLATIFFKKSENESRMVVDDSYQSPKIASQMTIPFTNEQILLQKNHVISSLSDSRHKQLLWEAKEIIIKQLGIDITDAFNNREMNIVLYKQARRELLNNYVGDKGISLFFLKPNQEGSFTLYLDLNFFNYFIKDNATRSYILAATLAFAYSYMTDLKQGNKDYERITDKAYENLFAIMPGKTFFQIEKTFLSGIAGVEKILSFNFSINSEVKINLSFIRKLTGQIKKFTNNKDKETFRDIIRRLDYIKKELFLAYSKHEETLTVKQSALSSFLSFGQIRMFERSLKNILRNKGSNFHNAQLENFQKSLRQVSSLMNTADSLRLKLLAYFGVKVKLTAVKQHKNITRFEISVMAKDVDYEKLLPVLNSISDEGKLEFSGFINGLPVWKNSHGNNMSENEFIVDIKDLSPELMQKIIRQINTQEKAISELLSSVIIDSPYEGLLSENKRKTLYLRRIEGCNNSSDVIKETMLYLVYKNITSLNLDCNLFEISELALKVLNEVYSFSDKKSIIHDALRTFRIVANRKHKGEKVSLMRLYKTTGGDGLVNFFRGFKKGDLHRHITGSISPELLLEEFWLDFRLREIFVKMYYSESYSDLLSEELSPAERANKIDDIFIRNLGGPSDNEKRVELKSLIKQKHYLMDSLINSIKGKDQARVSVLRNNISVIQERIKDLFGGDETIELMKEYIEYRPDSKSGVSIVEYLNKLEPAKIPLKGDNPLKVMTRYARDSVLNDFYFDNIYLTELRTSGVRAGDKYTQEEAVFSYIKGLIEAEIISENKISSAYILCLYKDLQSNLHGGDKELLRRDLNNLKDKSIADVKKWLISEIREEINSDYPELSTQEIRKIMMEERKGVEHMLEDATLQINYGRIEDFSSVYENLNFHLKKRDDISTDEITESLKIKMIYFLHSRKIFLQQVKDLLKTKQKWSLDPDMKIYADHMVGIDAVWSELDEIVWPSLAAFRYAKKHGLSTTYHVGESWNEGEFKSALLRIKRVLDADYIDRLGHGTALGVYINNLGGKYSEEERRSLKAIQRALFRHRNIKKTVIESCETSNVLLTEDLPGYDQHVASFFLRKMFNVVLAQDNGTVLHTNGLSGELARLWLVNPAMSFVDTILLIANSYRNSFMKGDSVVDYISSIFRDNYNELNIRKTSDFLSSVDNVVLFGNISLQMEKGFVKSIVIEGDGKVDLPEIIAKEDLMSVFYYKDGNDIDQFIVITSDDMLFRNSTEEQWVLIPNFRRNYIDKKDIFNKAA